MIQIASSPRTVRHHHHHHHHSTDDDNSNLNDFKEVLQAEVYVDVEKLRDSARHGIPAEIRGVCLRLPIPISTECLVFRLRSLPHCPLASHANVTREGNMTSQEVWKYLLGVQEADRCEYNLAPTSSHHPGELTTTKARSEEYQQIEKQNSEITKRVRGEVTRYQRRVPSLASKEVSTIFENVINAYLNYNRQVDYSPALIPLCAPFVVCLKSESEVYYCFERLQQQMGTCLVSGHRRFR
ncbi:hypothetical protein BC936DRAFT_143196 [Jimgerdemannia flammicorona]|uniref:Rab-GAP TBC domain-containing protein n=1 Tax=Jimgerdemannia flammicorona TaxID=994334 RepID=A0A432ZZB3_9FUNG|nr:hypothetical protein BC936DRAFT_143196 [Jimgerdemannia flammicorona]